MLGPLLECCGQGNRPTHKNVRVTLVLERSKDGFDPGIKKNFGSSLTGRAGQFLPLESAIYLVPNSKYNLHS